MFLLHFPAFQSMLFTIQHILGGQKLSRMMSLLFALPFVLGSSIPGYLGSIEFQFLSSHPSETDRSSRMLLSVWPVCPVRVIGKSIEGKRGSSLWLPWRPLMSWLSLLVLSMPSDKLGLSGILSHFYSCFHWEIWSDIAVPS